MSDEAFQAALAQHTSMPEDEQKKAGAPVQGSLGGEEADFLEKLFSLLDSGTIRIDEPRSLVNKYVYDKLDEEWQDKVDFALINIIKQVELIQALRKQEDGTPSVHMQTMVQQLWDMKQRIEEHFDAFVL